MMRPVFVSIVALLALQLQYVSAQKTEPKFTFNVELALPNATVNKPYRDIMQGLGCASLYGQYSFPFHFHIGLGARYSLFTVNEFSVSEEIYGQIHSATGFVKLGWDKFHNDRFATDFAIKIGYGPNYFTTDANEELGVNPVVVNASMVEPCMGLILNVDSYNSFRIHLGYNIMGYGFKPQLIGMQSDEGYDPKEFDRVSQSFIIGFGYTYYFSKDKKKD